MATCPVINSIRATGAAFYEALDLGLFLRALIVGAAAGALENVALRHQLAVWATFQTDHVGLRLLDVLGDDRVMWASDYPHADSTWPESRKAMEDNFKDVPPGARRRKLCENARQLYGAPGK